MHERKLSGAVAMLGSLLAAGAPGAADFDPNTNRICAEARQLELPAGDRPSAEEAKDLGDCVSQALYFGLGQAADPVRARKCAYAELERGVPDFKIASRAILAMIYANGKGVPRNFDLALKLACELEGIKDLPGTVLELSRYKAAHWTGEFSVCDHSSARPLYDECAILAERFDSVKRQEKLEALVSQWPAPDRNAVLELRRAADAFYAVQSRLEVDLESTLQVQEQAHLEREFIGKLERLERGERPSYSEDDAQKAKAGLAEQLARIRAATISSWGSVTKEAIEQTQQAWVPYREAWVKFLGVRYPKVTGASWITWLTEERLAMLQKAAPVLELPPPDSR